MKITHPAWFVMLAVSLGCGRDDASSAPTTAAASPSATAATATAGATAAAAPAVQAPPSNVPDSIEGANVTMETSTVDGLEMERIQCKGGGGLFGGVALLGGLAKQKEAFAACAPDGETVRVHFAFEAGKTSDVRVAGASSAEVSRCVADAVAAATFSDKGVCVLSVKVGKP